MPGARFVSKAICTYATFIWQEWALLRHSILAVVNVDGGRYARLILLAPPQGKPAVVLQAGHRQRGELVAAHLEARIHVLVHPIEAGKKARFLAQMLFPNPGKS